MNVFPAGKARIISLVEIFPDKRGSSLIDVNHLLVEWSCTRAKLFSDVPTDILSWLHEVNGGDLDLFEVGIECSRVQLPGAGCVRVVESEFHVNTTSSNIDRVEIVGSNVWRVTWSAGQT